MIIWIICEFWCCGRIDFERIEIITKKNQGKEGIKRQYLGTRCINSNSV